MTRKSPRNGAMPVLPLRDVVVFPRMVMSLFVGRPPSIKALEESVEGDSTIVLLAQRSPEVDEPKPADLFGVGTLATILQMLKLPDGTAKVLVEGQERVHIRALDAGEAFVADA